jgi:hypothetical protein
MSAARIGQPPPASSSLFIESVRAARMLWIATAIVIALGLSREILVALEGEGFFPRHLRHLSFDGGYGLPIWYEALLMAGAALLLAVCAALSRTHDPDNRSHWLLLSLLFLVFSACEASAVHELLLLPLRQSLDLGDRFYLSWFVVGAPLLLLLCFAFLRFLARLPLATARGFVTAGAYFIMGAFCLEIFSGYVATRFGAASFSYRLCSSFEETFELLGLTIFVVSLHELIASRAPVLTLRSR